MKETKLAVARAAGSAVRSADLLADLSKMTKVEQMVVNLGLLTVEM